MQMAGATQVGALMPPSVPGSTLAACGMPLHISCLLFPGSIPHQPNRVLPAALGSLNAAEHRGQREARRPTMTGSRGLILLISSSMQSKLSLGNGLRGARIKKTGTLRD